MLDNTVYLVAVQRFAEAKRRIAAEAKRRIARIAFDKDQEVLGIENFQV